jgi:hypothetical protein
VIPVTARFHARRAWSIRAKKRPAQADGPTMDCVENILLVVALVATIAAVAAVAILW